MEDTADSLAGEDLESASGSRRCVRIRIEFR